MNPIFYLFAKPILRTLFVLVLLIVTFITAAATGFNLFYRLSYALVSILLIGYLWSWFMLIAVRVQIIDRLNQTEVGESFEQKIQIINDSFIPKFGLELKDMTDLPGHAGGVAINIRPFGETEIALDLKARKRGLYQIGPIEISNSDPFNLFIRSKKFGAKQSVIVYPRTVDLSALATPSAELYGDSLSRKKTYRVTPHANSVRDYVYGDSFNRIHWNSTARMGKLMSKEFDIGRSSEVWIVGDFNKMLRSEVLYDLKDRPFTMSGKIDGYIKHKDSFTIVDFKTTKINENKIDAYATQLQSYALMMEKPKEGSLKLTPIKRLGIFCFEPSNITEADGNNCNMHMDTQWFEIPRDDKDLIGYITKIQDVLYSKETPESGSSCGICNFRKVMK